MSDKNEHDNRNIDPKIKGQKAREEKLGCEFIRLTLTKRPLIFSELPIKYLDKPNNWLKNSNNFQWYY